MTARIAVLVEDTAWRRRVPELAGLARRAARAALRAGDRRDDVELAIVFARDERVRDLNRRFRRKDEPTNVLSFPADAAVPGGRALLGDVVLARETCTREAREQAKTLRAHATHLIVHGVLHLIGHDHRRAREAERMEALERTILARLGVADPYAERRRAA